MAKIEGKEGAIMESKEGAAVDRLIDQLKYLRKCLDRTFGVLRPIRRRYPSRDLETVNRDLLKVCDQLLHIHEKPLTRIVDRIYK